METQRGPRYRAVVTTSQPGTKREQATSTHDTLSAARAWVDETRANVRSGTYVRESKVTVAEMCDRWLTTTISTAVAAQELRQVTADSYTRSLLPARRRQLPATSTGACPSTAAISARLAPPRSVLAAASQVWYCASFTTLMAIGMKAWSLPHSSEHCP